MKPSNPSRDEGLALADIAAALGTELRGDGQRRLRRLSSVGSAGPDALCFIASAQYRKQLSGLRAGAVILTAELASECPVDCLVTPNPYLAFARASQLFECLPPVAEGVHPSAVVSPDAVLGDGASVGPNACIGAGARLGDGVIIGPNCVVGEGVQVGCGTRLWANVTLYHGVIIGERCILHSGAVIGADGFGFARGSQGWEKIAQLGSVIIGNDVEIGANTTIDRGALDDTVIASGVKIDDQVMIAHNCRIGRNTAIAGCVGMAGSTVVGENCTLAGGVGLTGHITLADNVHITSMSMVTRSLNEPGSYSSGTPLSATVEWRRSAARFNQLDAMYRRLVALEKLVAAGTGGDSNVE